MAATSDDLRRALGTLEGPLRFARKGGHALQNLRGFESAVGAAVARARLLKPDASQKASLDRLVRFVAGFDALDLPARTLAVGAVIREITSVLDTSDTPTEELKPPPAPEKKTAADVTADVFSRPVSVMKGVGPAVAARLATRGLHTLGDLLLFLPRRYEDRRQETRIAALAPESHALVRARIATFNERVAFKKLYELTVVDDTGELVVKWFGFRPSQFRAFVPGATVVLSGDVRTGAYGRREMIHPDLEFADAATDVASFGRIIPVYPEIEGMSARAFRRLALRVVTECAHEITEFHPPAFLRQQNLVPLADAIGAVHFPPNDADFTTLARFASPAQRRLVFDELFFVQLGLALRRRGVQLEKGIPLRVDDAIRARALARLPFQLTGAQSRAFAEVVSDLVRASPMNRLLQGDVGSGKTAVALASALLAVENGHQAAIMAPTELLAEQHFRNFERLLGGISLNENTPPIRIALVAAGLKGKVLERARREVESGTARIVVGTHALLSQSTHFQDLALVVVDEQHRFGVVQRATLTEKGLRPHVLVMTATPIPRTLALTLYGDLDVSVIDELPPGRTPVTTRLFTSRTREKAYSLAQNEIAQGRQVYVVLPLVEESEKLELRAATEEHARLQAEEFRGLRVGLVHGRLSSEERDAEMDRFRRGETQVLVATTVIEVGVDVPNASVMIIEHAERFGLSQLHQLRGRVGRGSAKSYCLLLYDEEAASQVGRQRLNVMVKTNDGFRLSEEDLSIRGPGDFLGTRQSGLPDLIVADLLRDQAILKEARAAAFDLTTDDPDVLRPENRTVRAELERRWAGKLSLARVG